MWGYASLTVQRKLLRRIIQFGRAGALLMFRTVLYGSSSGLEDVQDRCSARSPTARSPTARRVRRPEVHHALPGERVGVRDRDPAQVGEGPHLLGRPDGVGREGGYEGIEEYLETKYVAVNL